MPAHVDGGVIVSPTATDLPIGPCTLFERLGGKTGITALVHDFVAVLKMDKAARSLFRQGEPAAIGIARRRPTLRRQPVALANTQGKTMRQPSGHADADQECRLVHRSPQRLV